MLFDTHAHLDDKRFDQDRDELIRGLPDGVFRSSALGSTWSHPKDA